MLSNQIFVAAFHLLASFADEEVAGFFDSYGDAFTAGLQRFGSSRNFLIRQIWQAEPVYFVF